MTPKQLTFIAEYLVDLNATQAAIRAGYSERTAAEIGYENLRMPQIASALSQAMRARSERTEVTQDRVLEELAGIAFAHLSDVATWDSATLSLHPSDELSPRTSAAVKDIRARRTRSTSKDGTESVRTDYRVTMHDKLGALDLLAKHLGMYLPDTQVNVGVGVTLVRTTPDIAGNPVVERNTRSIDGDLV